MTLPSGGVEKSFRLGVEHPEITLVLRAVPLLDPNAYLNAAFTAAGEPQLRSGEEKTFHHRPFTPAYVPRWPADRPLRHSPLPR